jgi:hypothetical protein
MEPRLYRRFEHRFEFGVGATPGFMKLHSSLLSKSARNFHAALHGFDASFDD